MSMVGPLSIETQRRRWRVVGQVQGVGFRPFVYRLARRHGLRGSVWNDGRGVTIEAQGSAAQLDAFGAGLMLERPPLARIDGVDAEAVELRADETGFRIARSAAEGRGHAAVTVDTAVCEACMAELFDPGDRRYRYPLINCTACGPRYTIVTGVPYDRPKTTMAGFGLCGDCADEYADPADRRFHAEPVACEACGPRVSWVDGNGRGLGGEPIAGAAGMLREGGIVAIKGLGGFHLAVRADAAEAVERLRERKGREAKPLALMVAEVGDAARLVAMGEAGWAALRGPSAPIVLADRRAVAPVAEAVAPGSHRLGVMLAYTPIHHLLFAAMGPAVPALVMTSGNVIDEPIAIGNDEAVARLGPICDALLWHDRPIARCVDDSVLRDAGGAGVMAVRRSRGYAPAAIPLIEAEAAGEGLCVGGDLKNTVAIVRDGQAVLSQHLGDLGHALAYAHFGRAIDDLCALFQVEPRWVAHDMHPGYLSTRFARQWAARQGARCIAVQHHHAHAMAALAEHGHRGPALALVGDGVGYGADGAIWGGELLEVRDGAAQRRASLRPMRLAGGDAAAVDTRRCALGLLHQAFGDDFDQRRELDRLGYDRSDRRMLTAMIRRGIHAPQSTAMGRLFDGFAALLGLCHRNRYEAEAPATMEAAAHGAQIDDRLDAFDLRPDPVQPLLLRVDLSALTRRVVDQFEQGRAIAELAALVHDQLAAAWAAAAERTARQSGLSTVALSGGVMNNRRFSDQVTARLRASGLTVLRHERVPAGDGGLSLGQAQVAASRVMTRR